MFTFNISNKDIQVNANSITDRANIILLRRVSL